MKVVFATQIPDYPFLLSIMKHETGHEFTVYPTHGLRPLGKPNLTSHTIKPIDPLGGWVGEFLQLIIEHSFHVFSVNI